eukprot:1026470_1
MIISLDRRLVGLNMSHSDDDDEKKSIEIHTPGGPGLERKQIISIDFGSFGSIASYCLPQSPAKYVLVKEWKGMGTCDAAMQKKTLTALLWNIHDEKTVAFGYEAQTLYFEYRKIIRDKDKNKAARKLKKKFGDEHIKLAYFKHFKPHFVGDDPLQKDKYIWSTDNSAKLSIFDLITHSLIQIKKQAMMEAERVRRDTHLDLEGNQELKEDEVLWVISTPSVWDDTSRGAFKECVLNAGMIHHLIGLEPEFALFCMSKADEADFLDTDQNRISMVLDCGGGTVDATCVEIIAGGAQMEETLPRKGIDVGSLDIDDEYYRMLEGVLGKAFIGQFQEEQPHHWNGLQTSFWKAKHIVDTTEEFIDAGVHVEVPRAFWKLVKTKFNVNDGDLEEHVTNLFQKYCTNRYGEAHKDYIEYDEEDDSINIQIPVWNDFHKSVLDSICDFVRRLLSERSMKTCEHIILVGGFSQSKFLQQRLTSQFSDGIDEYDDRRIVFNLAAHPSWSVTIGGLFWAYNRKNYERKMWLTYGFEVNKPWEIGDPLSNRHRDMSTPSGFIKKHVFDPVIFKNDTFDENQQEQRHYTIPFNAGVLTLNLYAVDSEHGAEYTTDKDEDGGDICTIAAQYELKLKDEKWIKLTKQALPITIEFEETMLRILITQPDLRQHEMIIKNPRITK